MNDMRIIDNPVFEHIIEINGKNPIDDNNLVENKINEEDKENAQNLYNSIQNHNLNMNTTIFGHRLLYLRKYLPK